MKKRLTAEQFEEVVQSLGVGQQTLEIARGVLVEGRRQAEFVELLGLSRGAVSQAVNRVWKAASTSRMPVGFEKVTAVLPEHQAFIVKRWAEDALEKGRKK